MRTKYIIFLISVIFLLAFLLQPKITPLLFPQRRIVLLENFITKIQSNNTVNIKDYWEFREFYSPGNFIYDPSGIKEINSKNVITDQTLFSNNPDFHPILFFKSANMTSIGGLTQVKSLPPTNNLEIKSIYLKSDDTIVYKAKNDNTILIMFKPINEIKKANGFIHKSKEILNAKKYWYEVAIIN